MKGFNQKHERLKRTGTPGLFPSLDMSLQDVSSPPSDTFPEIGRILTRNPAVPTAEENSLPAALTEEITDTAVLDDLPKSTWDECTENMVLEQFKVVDPGKITKTKWKKISENINQHGYNFSPEQCRMKVKAFLKRHKRLSTKHVKTPTADDNLRNIKDAFDSYPNITPVFLIDSGHLVPMSTSNSTPSHQNGGSSGTEIQYMNEGIPDGPTTPKRRRKDLLIPYEVPSIDKLTNIEEMKEYLESLFGKREAAMKRRHQEKMALWGSLRNVLQDVAKKLTTNNEVGAKY